MAHRLSNAPFPVFNCPACGDARQGLEHDEPCAACDFDGPESCLLMAGTPLSPTLHRRGHLIIGIGVGLLIVNIYGMVWATGYLFAFIWLVAIFGLIVPLMCWRYIITEPDHDEARNLSFICSPHGLVPCYRGQCGTLLSWPQINALTWRTTGHRTFLLIIRCSRFRTAGHGLPRLSIPGLQWMLRSEFRLHVQTTNPQAMDRVREVLDEWRSRAQH